ncbi:MAG: 2Fe-2S iron-sulfur cluster binding domain-containing protein [Caulobacteraceae bacterium]
MLSPRPRAGRSRACTASSSPRPKSRTPRRPAPSRSSWPRPAKCSTFRRTGRSRRCSPTTAWRSRCPANRASAGTCLTPVLEGEPDHRDFYLTDDEHARGGQMTLCCSRAKTPLLVLDL